MKIREVRCKTILSKSKLPGCDFVINPYIGCSFGCKYCYAAFMGRWWHPGEKWGEFLDIKVNAPKVLAKELESLERRSRSKDFGSILFSSVTDPYLGEEAGYKITKKCLEVLVGFGYKGKVAILTKSPLVIRDIDLFKKLKAIVGLTITALDDKVSQFLEGRAPPSTARIKTLKKFNETGIETYVFIGPLLPYFTAQKNKLEELFSEIEKMGSQEIWLEHIYLAPIVKGRLFQYLKKEAPELIPEFRKSDTQEYRNELEKAIKETLKGKNLRLARSEVIYHRQLSKT